MAKYYNEKVKESIARYQKDHVQQIKFNFSREYDADILDKLETVGNKQGYIKSLIRADIARANSEQKEEDKPMIKITFEAGTSRNGNHGVNYMMPAPGADSPDLYAEIPVPEGADEEYGYFALKDEIIRQAIAQNIDPATLEFWYDGQEEYLSSAARATVGANSEQKEEDKPGPWYAVQTDPSDDWSTGSYDLEEAKARAREMREDYPDTLIAVIDNSTDQPVCIDEIRDF